eukprot:m.740147 g.740147  ORF g.740147 m.740147 type:complete len:158 (-) comp58924_c0_seq5:2976-3449(-)
MLAFLAFALCAGVVLAAPLTEPLSATTTEAPAPVECGAHMHYSTCGGCAPTCANPIRICPAVCVPQCVCAKGYILDEDAGECVLVGSCPHSTPEPSTTQKGCTDTSCSAEEYWFALDSLAYQKSGVFHLSFALCLVPQSYPLSTFHSFFIFPSTYTH